MTRITPQAAFRLHSFATCVDCASIRSRRQANVISLPHVARVRCPSTVRCTGRLADCNVDCTGTVTAIFPHPLLPRPSTYKAQSCTTTWSLITQPPNLFLPAVISPSNYPIPCTVLTSLLPPLLSPPLHLEPPRSSLAHPPITSSSTTSYRITWPSMSTPPRPHLGTAIRNPPTVYAVPRPPRPALEGHHCVRKMTAFALRLKEYWSLSRILRPLPLARRDDPLSPGGSHPGVYIHSHAPPTVVHSPPPR